MALEALAALAPGRVLATGHRRAVAGARCALAAPAPARGPGPTRCCGRWPRRPRSASPGSAGRRRTPATLLAGEDETAAKALAAAAPRPVDHVLLQADLTAVAPGPLESAAGPPAAAASPTWSRAAGRPSTGSPPARCAARSTRGWTAVEVHEFLGSVSRTPVPQPLTYLVDDTARTFGTVRVGHAEAFLRADDEAALDRAAAPPEGARTLGLRRLAPTVLVSTTPLDVLLPRLRELGAAPVVEAADGTVRVARPDLLRARTPREHRGRGAARGPATAPGRGGGHRDPGRRPGRRVTARRAPSGDSRRPGRWPRCGRRSRPAPRC